MIDAKAEEGGKHGHQFQKMGEIAEPAMNHFAVADVENDARPG